MAIRLSMSMDEMVQPPMYLSPGLLVERETLTALSYMLDDPMYVKTQVRGNQDGQAIAEEYENHDFRTFPSTACTPSGSNENDADSAPGEAREGGSGENTPTALIPVTRTP